MTVMPLDQVPGLDRVVSESIPDLDMGICSIWPRKGCLLVLSRNPIRHNEDVVTT